MSSSLVQIYNLALFNVGSSKTVAATDEGSQESNLCNALYEHCRDFLLREFPWRFAKKRLALAVKAGTPPAEWAFQYTKPSDCLKVRGFVLPGSRNPLPDSRIAFEVTVDPADDGEIIYTDLEDAELIYTMRVTNTTRFDASFVEALALLMATKLAIPLRGKPDVVQMLRQGYAMAVSQAAANSMSEGFEHPPTCSLLAARGGTDNFTGAQ